MIEICHFILASVYRLQSSATKGWKLYLSFFETFSVCAPECVRYQFISGERNNSSSEVLTIVLTTRFLDNAFLIDKEGVLFFETVHLALAESVWLVCYSEIFPPCKQANFDLSINLPLFVHSSSSRHLIQLCTVSPLQSYLQLQ